MRLILLTPTARERNAACASRQARAIEPGPNYCGLSAESLGDEFDEGGPIVDRERLGGGHDPVEKTNDKAPLPFDLLCYEFSEFPLVVSKSAFVIPSGWGGIAAARSVQTRHSIPSAFGPL